MRNLRLEVVKKFAKIRQLEIQFLCHWSPSSKPLCLLLSLKWPVINYKQCGGGGTLLNNTEPNFLFKILEKCFLHLLHCISDAIY